jgi:hypothetical protein
VASDGDEAGLFAMFPVLGGFCGHGDEEFD